MAQPHFCPYCQSTNTVPILKDPTRRQYLCQECHAVHWVPDTSASGVTTWRTRKDGKPTARKRLTKDVRPRRTLCRRAPDRLPVARRPHQRARVASGIRRSVSRSGGIRSPVVRWVPGRAWGDATSGCTGCIQSTPRHRSSTRPQAPPPRRKGTETWTHDSRDRGDPL
jgi:hypothetical protein